MSLRGSEFPDTGGIQTENLERGFSVFTVSSMCFWKIAILLVNVYTVPGM